MGVATAIGWTHSTLNFWRGCQKVDPTCAACYMFREQRRYGHDPNVVVRCSDGIFYAPLRSRKWQAERDRYIAEFGVHLVFVCSWSDFFHEDADSWRADAWDVIRQTPESTYQILTSRPERILDHLPADWGDGWPNVWMMTTIGNRRFVHRADLLRQVPAVVRGLSVEPMLGPVIVPEWGGLTRDEFMPWPDYFRGPELDLTDIHWVICGGESGGKPHRALVDEHGLPRQDRIGWVRDLRDACVSECSCSTLGVEGGAEHVHRPAFFFKQWGGKTPKSGGRLLDGRTWDEFPVAMRLPEDLLIREFPAVSR